MDRKGKLLRLAFTASPSAIIITNKDGRILMINPQAQKLFGYTGEEIRGKRIEVLIPERFRKDHVRFRTDFNSDPQTRPMGAGRDLFGLRKDGTEFPVEVGLSPSEDGLYVVGSIVDISERKKIEIEKEKTHQEVETANKMRDEFLAIISHELRTPLQAIIGWSRILLLSKMDNPQTLKALHSIERSAKNQEKLINDILDVSRIITGKLDIDRQIVNLESAVRAVIDAMSVSAKNKNISLGFDIPDRQILILGDPARLHQILINLVSNAIKFTPAEGTVSVSLSVVQSLAQITVADTGVGISQDFMPYIFDRFRQAESSHNRAYGGLGLGLSIVKHLLDLHRGSIKVESEGLNKGSVFTVRIPILPLWHGADIETGDDETVYPELEGLGVLVVDDDGDTRDLVRTLLEMQKMEVRLAESADEGLEILSAHRIDLIISDLEMPKEDGFSFIKKARSELGIQAPAIALTAHAKKEMGKRATEAGFNLHIAKPVGPIDLLHIISGIMKKS